MSRRVLIQLPEFMGGQPFITTVTIGAEIKFSLRTREDDVAEFRRSVALAELNKVFAAIRAGPRSLTHKQLLGLARAIHELYVEAFQEDPGSNDVWIAHKALNRAVAEGRITDVEPIIPGQMPDDQGTAVALFGDDLTAGINVLPRSDDINEGLERRFGLLTDWLLTQNGQVVDGDTRNRLLMLVAHATDTGVRRLKDNIAGNYGEDHRLAQYPIFEQRSNRTFTQAFEDWKREARPAPSTLMTWRGNFKSLREFLGHDEIRRLQRSDVVAWKDHLVGRSLASKTINAGHLASLSTLLNYEVQNGRLASNVAEGVKTHSRERAGEKRLAYTREEAAKLLSLAKSQDHPNLRWLPWLAATTGSRIGEVAQLWGQRVKTIEGMPVIEIAPAEDGGRLKNVWSERTMPLHPSLIEQGFMEFARSKGDGPLFYNFTSGDPQRGSCIQERSRQSGRMGPGSTGLSRSAKRSKSCIPALVQNRAGGAGSAGQSGRWARRSWQEVGGGRLPALLGRDEGCRGPAGAGAVTALRCLAWGSGAIGRPLIRLFVEHIGNIGPEPKRMGGLRWAIQGIFWSGGSLEGERGRKNRNSPFMGCACSEVFFSDGLLLAIPFFGSI
ncbi:MAG: hypothetical protein J0H40_12400 [Rhizobiales bacterium]|nr:hypothetical protein [Hyphomicrobiales bacterium]